jgi:ketosteroid isomerase-like protein
MTVISGAHPNVEVFKRVYDAFTSGDMDGLAELIAPDVVWHVPGTNVISGEYTSRDAIFGCFNKIFELSAGTYRPQLHDIVANDQHTVALMHVTARRGDKKLDQDYAFISHIRAGQIAELWEAWIDGTAWNEFWSEPR